MPTALAIFDDSSSLQRALDELHASGISGERIRVIEGAERASRTDEAAADTGPLLAGDPQAAPGDTRVATAGVGPYVAPGSTSGTPMPAAAVGGLHDSLRGFDVDEEEARYFGDSLDEDTHLLAVSLEDDAERVYTILRSAGASRSNDPGR